MSLADVDAERRADVAIDEIRASAETWHRQHRRPRALTARDALVALEFEALLVCTAACNLANGDELSDVDRQRLLLAYNRIDTILGEVTG